MIEEQIAVALSTVPDVNVYPVVLPRSPRYPSVTYHRRNYEVTSDQWSMNPLVVSPAEGAMSLFQVVVYAETYTQCSELLRAVKTALEDVPGMILDSVQDGYEWKQNVFAIVTEWAVWGDLAQRTPDSYFPAWELLNPAIDAVLASLVEDFNDRVKTVRLHDPQIRSLKTPALVLDVTRIAPGKETSDDLRALILNLSVYCLYPYSRNMIPYVASMAADVFNHIRYNKWGLGNWVDYPDNMVAEREPISPGVYSQWVIHWEQTVYTGADEAPVCYEPEPYYSVSPDIGLDNQEDYVPLVTDSPCDE